MKISFPLAAEAASLEFTELIDDLLAMDFNDSEMQARIAQELGRKPFHASVYAQDDIGAYYSMERGGPVACITSKEYASGKLARSKFTVFLDNDEDMLPNTPTQIAGFNDYRSALNAWRALL